MLEIKKLKTHKKYFNEYFLLYNEVYSKEELTQFFNTDATLTEEADNKTIKPYKYKSNKYMQKQINEKQKELFKSLSLQRAKTVYENLKVAQPLLKHFIKNVNHNALIIEDRLLSFKNKKFELQQNKKSIDNAYKKEVYNKEKEFKKTKNLLKQIEKQTTLQNTKMLYDTLVNQKTTNTNDCFNLMYLLNKLNIQAYCLVLKNKETNSAYTLLLIPSKKNNYETIKYYVVDPTKERVEIKQQLKQESKIEFFGKSKLQKDYNNYELTKLENLQKVIFPTNTEWNKIIKQIASDVIEFNL